MKKLVLQIALILVIILSGCLNSSNSYLLENYNKCTSLTADYYVNIPKCDSTEKCISYLNKNFKTNSKLINQNLINRYKNLVAESWSYINEAKQSIKSINSACYNNDLNKLRELLPQINRVSYLYSRVFVNIHELNKLSIEIIKEEKHLLENQKINLAKDSEMYKVYESLINNLNDYNLSNIKNIDTNQLTYVKKLKRRSEVLATVNYNYSDFENLDLTDKELQVYSKLYVKGAASNVEFFYRTNKDKSDLENISKFLNMLPNKPLLAMAEQYLSVDDSALVDFFNLVESISNAEVKDELYQKETKQPINQEIDTIEAVYNNLKKKNINFTENFYKNISEYFNEIKIKNSTFQFYDFQTLNEYLPSILENSKNTLNLNNLLFYEKFSKLKDTLFDLKNLKDNLIYLEENNLENICSACKNLSSNLLFPSIPKNLSFIKETLEKTKQKVIDSKNQMNSINKCNSHYLSCCEKLINNYNSLKSLKSKIDQYEKYLSSIDSCLGSIELIYNASILDNIFLKPYNNLINLSKNDSNYLFLQEQCVLLKENITNYYLSHPKIVKIKNQIFEIIDLLDNSNISKEMYLEYKDRLSEYYKNNIILENIVNNIDEVDSFLLALKLDIQSIILPENLVSYFISKDNLTIKVKAQNKNSFLEIEIDPVIASLISKINTLNTSLESSILKIKTKENISEYIISTKLNKVLPIQAVSCKTICSNNSCYCDTEISIDFLSLNNAVFDYNISINNLQSTSSPESLAKYCYKTSKFYSCKSKSIENFKLHEKQKLLDYKLSILEETPQQIILSLNITNLNLQKNSQEVKIPLDYNISIFKETRLAQNSLSSYIKDNSIVLQTNNLQSSYKIILTKTISISTIDHLKNDILEKANKLFETNNNLSSYNKDFLKNYSAIQEIISKLREDVDIHTLNQFNNSLDQISISLENIEDKIQQYNLDLNYNLSIIDKLNAINLNPGTTELEESKLLFENKELEKALLIQENLKENFSSIYESNQSLKDELFKKEYSILESQLFEYKNILSKLNDSNNLSIKLKDLEESLFLAFDMSSLSEIKNKFSDLEKEKTILIKSCLSSINSTISSISNNKTNFKEVYLYLENELKSISSAKLKKYYSPLYSLKDLKSIKLRFENLILPSNQKYIDQFNKSYKKIKDSNSIDNLSFLDNNSSNQLFYIEKQQATLLNILYNFKTKLAYDNNSLHSKVKKLISTKQSILSDSNIKKIDDAYTKSLDYFEKENYIKSIYNFLLLKQTLENIKEEKSDLLTGYLSLFPSSIVPLVLLIIISLFVILNKRKNNNKKIRFKKVFKGET